MRQRTRPFEGCRCSRFPSWQAKERLHFLRSRQIRWSSSRCCRSKNWRGGGRLAADESSIRSLHTPRSESSLKKNTPPWFGDAMVTACAPSSKAECSSCSVQLRTSKQPAVEVVLRRNARVGVVWQRAESVTLLAKSPRHSSVPTASLNGRRPSIQQKVVGAHAPV